MLSYGIKLKCGRRALKSVCALMEGYGQKVAMFLFVQGVFPHFLELARITDHKHPYQRILDCS